MGEQRSSGRKWAATALKLTIVVVVLLAIRGTLVEGIGQLSEHDWDFDLAGLFSAGVIYLLGLLPAGLFWHRVLRVLGQDAKLGETLRAYYIGHLGKYVPGKAMVVVIRAGLIRGHRVKTSVAALSVFFETLTMMAAGAFIAAAIVAAQFRQHATLFWVAVGLMLVAGLPTLPPVLRRLARLAGVGKSDPETDANLKKLGYGTLLLGWAAMAICWIVLGVSFWVVLRAMGAVDSDLLGQLPICTAGVSLAMVAGFLSLVPGGAFVREAVLTELMVPQLGPAAALVGAVLLRMVWLLAELLLSGILYLSKLCSAKDG